MEMKNSTIAGSFASEVAASPDGSVPDESVGSLAEKPAPQTGQGGAQDVTIEAVALKQTIGVRSAISILVTSCGGCALFISPTAILRYGGSPGLTLLLWAVAGFINLGLAICFIEVALVLPKAGGPYFYILEVWGSFPGFIMLWGFLTMIIAPSWAIAAMTASLYLTPLFNFGCPPPDLAVKLLAAWMIVSLVVINCLYMKYVTRIQSVLVAFKIIACVIIIVTGLANLGTDVTRENLQAFLDDSSTDPGTIALGVFSGYFSYGGWQIITVLMEEVKNPAKIVPKAVGCAFTIIISMSVLTNFSYFLLLSPKEMLQSDAVAVTFSQRVHPALTVAISVLVSLTAVGVANVLIMGQPRLMLAGGRIGHMPRLFAMLSRKYHTPWPATFTLAIPALIMLLTGTVSSLINTMSLFVCFMVSFTVFTLLYLRWTRPEIVRPLKAPLWLPILELFLALAILVLSVSAKPAEFGRLLLILLCGIPVYILGVWWEAKPKVFLRFMDSATDFFKWLLDVDRPQSD